MPRRLSRRRSIATLASVRNRFRVLTSRSPATALASAALIVSLTGVAYAAIPSADGTIRSCYAKSNGLLVGIPYSKGDVRLVDEGEACRNYEQSIAWNQQGDPGAPGASATALWAVINGDGSVARGSHVLTRGGTFRAQPGSYFVEFDRNISGCAHIVTPEGAFEAGLAGQPSQTQVQVFTRNQNGTFADSRVHVAVFC